jgi:hypothetical protein
MGTSTPTPGGRQRAGWYADPSDRLLIRYWDGQGWTSYTLPKPDGWGTVGAAAARPWWQTWWVIALGALLACCFPLGLIGAIVGDDDTTGKASDDSSAATHSTSPPTPTPTPEAPSPTAPPRSVVPRLTGLSKSKAEDRLAAVGLSVREVRRLPSPKPPGTVLHQSRDAGTSVLTGATVVLVVAVPYPQVPDVVGKVKAAAVARLHDAGFKVTVTSETRTSGKDGAVLRQKPSGLSRAKPHSTVAIVVASVVHTVAPPTQNCTSGYNPCLAPAYDYDCAGGSGDGPAYAYGPIYVTGSDPYDLDADGDGVACED